MYIHREDLAYKFCKGHLQTKSLSHSIEVGFHLYRERSPFSNAIRWFIFKAQLFEAKPILMLNVDLASYKKLARYPGYHCWSAQSDGRKFRILHSDGAYDVFEVLPHNPKAIYLGTASHAYLRKKNAFTTFHINLEDEFFDANAHALNSARSAQSACSNESFVTAMTHQTRASSQTSITRLP